MIRTSTVDHLVASHPLERSVLEQPQHLGLRVRGHVAHFVEENRASIRLLEFSDALPVRACEGSLLVAEQLTLQERLRYAAQLIARNGPWLRRL